MIVGLGIDCCGIERMRRIWTQHGERFLRHWFAASEARLAAGLADPADRLAGRWAAKEACAKALGTGFSAGITPSQIAIVSGPGGAPRLQLAGAALARAEALGATIFHVSLSHADGMAVAVVILERP